MSRHTVIRVSEWSSVDLRGRLTSEQRAAIASAAESWRLESRLSQHPLSFSGPQGDTLCAVQHVGVVEVAGCSVEIYPKLDRDVVERTELTDMQPSTVMGRLLWMLQASAYMECTASDSAHLRDAPMDYYDLFAYLMARNLLTELQRGVPHTYVPQEGDLPAVRGRIALVEQITRNWNRFDRVACRWEEFTADAPINRLFKCACRVLRDRVTNPSPVHLLDECCHILDEVRDISVHEARTIANELRWDRSNDRFQRCFEMARQMLCGSGYHLGVGADDTFVFLLDMNDVFERFTAAAISAHFFVPVQEQEVIGYLFPPRGRRQKPDYVWSFAGRTWIGDAKYKHLARGQRASLDPEGEDDDEAIRSSVMSAEAVLSPADVRQMTVYAELSARACQSSEAPDLAIFYPYVGSGPFRPSRTMAWNGSQFWLIPVNLSRTVDELGDVIPPLTDEVGAATRSASEV